MTALTTDALLSDLRKHGLLTPVEWSELNVVGGRTVAPKDVGLALTERGLLTRYQVDVALRGQAGRLVFGPYVLLDRIAEGGMGVVYRARHLRLGRTVALKAIRHDKLKSRVVARRFLREIRLTASLEHPYIVRAYDAGVVGDQLYLATEYIRGRDLGTLVRQSGPLGPAEACLAVYQTALALQHIYERGMVHRDVKPSNLIRDDATGTVKVLDLGLCGVPHEGGAYDSHSGTITRNGVLLGTPDYISPEQAVTPHEVDIRADLYSLGCAFYYLLVGRPPFAGGVAVDKLVRHLYEPLPPLAGSGASVPQAVVEVVARLTAKKPQDRYQTPGALAEALLALRPTVSGASAASSEPDPFEQLAAPGPAAFPTRADRSRTWGWALGGVIGAGLCVGLLAGTVSQFKSRPAAASPPTHQGAKAAAGRTADR